MSSGPLNVAVTAGKYYVLGVGSNCSAGYYYDNTGGYAGANAGIGVFSNNRWSNAYPGPSNGYVPAATGTSVQAYAQKVVFGP